MMRRWKLGRKEGRGCDPDMGRGGLGDGVREIGGHEYNDDMMEERKARGGGEGGGGRLGGGEVEVRGGRKKSEQRLPGNVRRECECRV